MPQIAGAATFIHPYATALFFKQKWNKVKDKNRYRDSVVTWKLS